MGSAYFAIKKAVSVSKIIPGHGVRIEGIEGK